MGVYNYIVDNQDKVLITLHSSEDTLKYELNVVNKICKELNECIWDTEIELKSLNIGTLQRILTAYTQMSSLANLTIGYTVLMYCIERLGDIDDIIVITETEFKKYKGYKII